MEQKWVTDLRVENRNNWLSSKYCCFTWTEVRETCWDIIRVGKRKHWEHFSMFAWGYIDIKILMPFLWCVWYPLVFQFEQTGVAWMSTHTTLLSDRVYLFHSSWMMISLPSFPVSVTCRHDVSFVSANYLLFTLVLFIRNQHIISDSFLKKKNKNN